MSVKMIYKVSSFQSRRHKKSHTDTYYENAEHTQWVFTSQQWFEYLIRVEYIQVGSNTNLYKMAVENSNLQFWADKQKQLMKEFEKHRIMECVVCYERTKWCDGTRCRTCKNSMCHKCCCEYSLANIGKFPCESDETGYSVEVLLPCPMCRTDNLFKY